MTASAERLDRDDRSARFLFRLAVASGHPYGALVQTTEQARPRSPSDRGPLLRAVYATVGVILLGLGIAGFLIPGLPGTPLLLVAAWLFSMSNERLYRWTTTNRWFGRAVADYRAGLGIPRKIKIISVTAVAIVVSISVFTALNDWRLQILVGALGLYGIYFVLTRPTRERVLDSV